MNEFKQHYQSLPSLKLQQIIENPDRYDPLAVKAAQAELASRNLDPEEISILKNQIEHTKQKDNKRAQKIESINNQAKSFTNNFTDTINPIQSKPFTLDRQIRVLAILFAVLFLFELYNNYYFFSYYFASVTPISLTELIGYTILIPLLLAISIALWKRFKVGWILAVFYVAYKTMSQIAMMILLLHLYLEEANRSIGTDDYGFTTQLLNYLPNYWIFIFGTLFYGVVLWVLFRKGISETFGVGKEAKRAVILVSLVYGISLIIQVLSNLDNMGQY